MKKIFISCLMAMAIISCNKNDSTKNQTPAIIDSTVTDSVTTQKPVVKQDLTGHYETGQNGSLDVKQKSESEIEFQGLNVSSDGAYICEVEGIAKLKDGSYEFKDLGEEGSGHHIKFIVEGKNLKVDHIKTDGMIGINGIYAKKSDTPKFSKI